MSTCAIALTALIASVVSAVIALGAPRIGAGLAIVTADDGPLASS